jgi:soluble lytic murein transglycosylase-like protein
LHLNGLSKELLSINLALHILSLLKDEVDHNTNFIALRYHEGQSRINSPATVKELFPQIPVESVSVKRIRKKPATKTDDLLWES